MSNAKPDASSAHEATPEYLRSLIERSGLSQHAAARRLGVSLRAMRYWIEGGRPCPYTAQFCLEALAEQP